MVWKKTTKTSLYSMRVSKCVYIYIYIFFFFLYIYILLVNSLFKLVQSGVVSVKLILKACVEKAWHMLVNSIFFSSSSLGKGHPDTLFSNKTDSKSTTRNRVRAAIPSPPQIKPESLTLLLSASHLDHNLSGTSRANQSLLSSFFPTAYWELPGKVDGKCSL